MTQHCALNLTALGIQPVYTSAAVNALGAAYKRQDAYFAGLTWLESHFNGNVDFVSRRVEPLSLHGDTLSNSLTYLNQNRDNNAGSLLGWGLSAFYTSSSIDTALALIANDEMGQTLSIQGALNFLKSTQHNGGLNDKGWTVSPVGGSDPAVTAEVVNALVRCQTVDSTLLLAITDALATLDALVGVSASPMLQAMAAQAAQGAGNSALASKYLDFLKTSQAADGSWNTDPYTTALAIQAMASTSNAADLAISVTIPDEALRRAINLALGRNAMDSLTRGELSQLTTLSAVGAGISDLTGLEWATNLSSINLNYNNLSDIAPLSNLAQLTTLNWIGNPGNTGGWLVPVMSLILE